MLLVRAAGRPVRGGVAVGEGAAAAMIAARRDDGASSEATWNVGTAPGQWRPTPPGFVTPATSAPPGRRP